MPPWTIFEYEDGPVVDPSDLALRPKYFSNPVINPSPSPTNQQIATNKDVSNRPTTFPATNRALNTIELLEQILENCLFTDLLTRLPRVSSTWKRVIDNNKYIQQHLFFTPWDKGDYPNRSRQINPYIQFFAFKQGDKWAGGEMHKWGPAPKKSEDEDTDDDADDADWDSEWWPNCPDIFYQINWPLIESDPRFRYEKASWRRMLPIQPPKREVWTFYRKKEYVLEVKWMRSIREKGKLLGEIYEDVVLLEQDPLCLWVNSYVRSNERYGAMTQIDVDLKPLPKEYTVEDTVEPGDSYLGKVRGGVRWMGRDGSLSKVVFEEWGKTPWLTDESL
ncbi:hypothetical protein G7Y89_g8638 [Cudoniella acicularis]|uniref:F-box domain-containing protein n=1 Tax=Cudoniella acicularis TaxID=354080 RepID=A0A8H4RIC3_9HELO|nr:hypothetical protein G7Y89_g8638 [Cudoniella acicularis]